MCEGQSSTFSSFTSYYLFIVIWDKNQKSWTGSVGQSLLCSKNETIQQIVIPQWANKQMPQTFGWVKTQINHLSKIVSNSSAS